MAGFVHVADRKLAQPARDSEAGVECGNCGDRRKTTARGVGRRAGRGDGKQQQQQQVACDFAERTAGARLRVATRQAGHEQVERLQEGWQAGALGIGCRERIDVRGSRHYGCPFGERRTGRNSPSGTPVIGARPR